MFSLLLIISICPPEKLWILCWYSCTCLSFERTNECANYLMKWPLFWSVWTNFRPNKLCHKSESFNHISQKMSLTKWHNSLPFETNGHFNNYFYVHPNQMLKYRFINCSIIIIIIIHLQILKCLNPKCIR